MVGEITKEEGRDIATDTLFVRVILARACLPATIIFNVVLPRWVLVAKEHIRHGRNRVFAVGDTGKRIQFTVDQICELLVPNLRES